MRRFFRSLCLFACCGLLVPACRQVLEPQPVASITDNLVLNEPRDAPQVSIGLYAAFRGVGAPFIIAGDLTADLLTHNGTFTQYRELDQKQISASNASVSALWGSIYRTIYVANFMLERLPLVEGMPDDEKEFYYAEARFLRGLAYFIGAYTYGGIPLVTTTDVATNRSVARATRQQVLDFVLEDYNYALTRLPDADPVPSFVSGWAVRAALARFHLYQGHWAEAAQWAEQIISTGPFQLDSSFARVALGDFPDESIFELGFTLSDPDNSLTDLLVSRRELIPSNQVLVNFLIGAPEAGTRRLSVAFDQENQSGGDNGWSVVRYNTADSDNNNIIVFRLAEMYLIRAEARARLNQLEGALADINTLRTRAKAPRAGLSGNVSQEQLLNLVERERVYELAFEGHRWYDLVRTGRADVVLGGIYRNWRTTYNVWPIPLGDVQRNPALSGAQNPGY